ncbi:MAG: glycerophosphodiester phosphodiesterase family protein [Candidatus Saccharimonadales bacterium]
MKIIGHRGARGLAPENTIRSLNKAIEYKVFAVEFDLRVTKDDVVILHHDHALKTASGDSLSIAKNSFDDLLLHKNDLARFDQVINKINFETKLMIEVKKNIPVTKIVNIIENAISAGRPKDSLFIGSKSQKILLQIYKLLPDISLVVIEPWSGVRATYRARQINTKIIAMNKLWLWRGFIKGMSKRGWQLWTYTLNNPTKANRWVVYGLDGVITDYPDLFYKQTASN